MNIFSNLVGQQITSGTRTGTGNNKLKRSCYVFINTSPKAKNDVQNL